MQCYVPDCDRSSHSKGLCLKHWKRWRRNGDPEIFDSKYLPRPLKERFREKVNLDGPIVVEALGPCEVWTGTTNSYGYGQLRVDGKLVGAHRLAFFFDELRWPWPFALHRCDNPPCVRRSHLFEGGYLENAADRQAKGRQNRQPGDLRRTVPRGEGMGRAAKLTADDVRRIRERAAGGESLSKISADYPVGADQISNIVKRKSWAHV